MLEVITLAALWFSIGLMVGIVYYKVLPIVKHMRIQKKQRLERINNYPKAYKISKPYTTSKN
jgi:hypothetical protein